MLTKKFRTCLSCAILFLFYGAFLTLPIYAQGAGQITAATPRATDASSAAPLAVGPVVYYSHRIDDDAGGASNGNGNGRAERGERVELVVTVLNQGNQTATGLTGTLRTSDTDVTIFDWTNYWPDIPGGATEFRGGNFGFEVNSNLSHDKSVTFTMTVSASSGGSWTSTFEVQIFAISPPPQVGPVVYVSHTIDDNNSGASRGDGDGRAENGERVEMVVTVRNQGNQTATGLTGALSTSDPDVTIFDWTNYWPDIPGGATEFRGGNFGFEVNSNLSRDKSVTFTMTISASNGGSWTSTFEVQIFAISPPPVTVPDAPVLISPTDGESGVPWSPATFRWGAAARAERYTLEFWSAPESQPPVRVTTDKTEYTTSLKFSEIYSWKVTASNSAGDGPSSPVWGFVTGGTSECANMFLTPEKESFGPAGGTGSFQVNARRACPWGASTNVGWLHVTGVSNGQGNGRVDFSVDPVNGPARQGFIEIKGFGGYTKAFEVLQMGGPQSTHTLTVASSNPSSGVNITVSPNDNNGQGGGTTTFTRVYNHNTTLTLTAPSTASGNNFLKWQRNGIDYSTSRMVTVTMDDEYTMTAVFVPPPSCTLTVTSSNPSSGVNITINPNDKNGQGSGITQFTRTYNCNTVVTLTAPATASGNSFQKWQRNGIDYSTSRTVTVTVDDNYTMTTVFTFVGIIRPISPQRVSSALNNEFDVYVEVQNVTNLFGVSFKLCFDATYLNAISEAAEPCIGSDVVFVGEHDNINGKVSVGVSRKSGQGGVSGSCRLVRIRFKVVKSVSQDTPVDFTLCDISATDPLGNPIVFTVEASTTILTPPGVIVWPGDTNNDRVVNQTDVLPIGLFWNRTGPARSPGGCSWSGQSASPWEPLAATYADCNGDGIVNQADVLCIGLNWGKTHTTILPESIGKVQSSLSAVLVPEISSVPMPGEEFFIRAKWAETTDLFGLAFELLYDRPDMLQILTVEPDDGFGANALFYSKAANAAGKIAVGISRKAGQEGSYAIGSAVRIKAKLTVNARLGETIAFSLQNVVANDAGGQPIEVRSQSFRMTIGSTPAVTTENATPLITSYRLHQNSPNPFWSEATSRFAGNPETVIRYEIPEAGPVLLKVYNFTGQEVRTLVNAFRQPGLYQISWDGRDAKGFDMPSGTYLYRLQAGSFSETRKMLLLR